MTPLTPSAGPRLFKQGGTFFLRHVSPIPVASAVSVSWWWGRGARTIADRIKPLQRLSSGGSDTGVTGCQDLSRSSSQQATLTEGQLVIWADLIGSIDFADEPI